MEVGQFFTQWFAEVWRILEVNMPFFNIPIWAVWAGILLIGVSIKAFKSIIDVGTMAPRDTVTYKSKVGGKYPRKGE